MRSTRWWRWCRARTWCVASSACRRPSAWSPTRAIRWWCKPSERSRPLGALALEPFGTEGVERRHLRPVEARHVLFHLVADLGLQIGEVAVADGEPRQQRLIEVEHGGRIDRVDAILFVDQPAQHDAPATPPLLQEVVEAPGAHHVADDAVDRGALRYRHLGLGNRAGALDIDRGAAEEMQNPHAARVALLGDPDEFLERALEPGGPHLPVGVPDGAEAIHHQGIAPDRPVFNQLPDCARVICLGSHFPPRSAAPG